MTEGPSLIAEARLAGVRLAFDGDRLSAYAASRPPADLIERLRAARPQLETLVRAEEQLLQAARHLDLVTAGRLPDPTTASTFIAACTELRQAFIEGNAERIRLANLAWQKALPAAESVQILRPGQPAEVAHELDRARQRLGRVAREFIHLRRPTWDEYEPIERARRSECGSGDLERGLAAIAEWEQAILDLLEIPDRPANIAAPSSA